MIIEITEPVDLHFELMTEENKRFNHILSFYMEGVELNIKLNDEELEKLRKIIK